MVPLSKRIADIITWSRVTLIPITLGLGLTKGSKAIPIVAVLMIYNWTADSLDGPLARRNPGAPRSWIGDHDLQIDMLVSSSLLGYMALSGIVTWQLALLYFLLWVIYFWMKGIHKSMGALFQAPIYLLLIVTIFREATFFAWAMVAWMILAMAFTWPKFPKVMVPEFLQGLRPPRTEE